MHDIVVVPIIIPGGGAGHYGPMTAGDWWIVGGILGGCALVMLIMFLWAWWSNR